MQVMLKEDAGARRLHIWFSGSLVRCLGVGFGLAKPMVLAIMGIQVGSNTQISAGDNPRRLCRQHRSRVRREIDRARREDR